MREMFRHVLATLAYRGTRVLRDAPDAFPFLELGHGVRTPLRILSHMGDLMASSSAILEDRNVDRTDRPGSWAAEVDRFYRGLKELDDTVASGAGSDEQLRRLLQGPVSDALTHVGQLALLRRVGGARLPKENFYRAHVEVGRVGPDQKVADSGPG